MHNVLSRSQLDEWRHFENSVDAIELFDQEEQKLNDYYECLIECSLPGKPQHEGKKICKQILS